MLVIRLTGPFAHVGKEVLERFKPPFANHDWTIGSTTVAPVPVC
jgi:hypothetical protein